MASAKHKASAGGRDGVVERIRERVRSDPTSAYGLLGIRLARRGAKNAEAICPLHEEKKPSFKVKLVGEHTGTWHCFGCGAGGDVFALLMKLENLTFPEAKNRLATLFAVNGGSTHEETGKGSRSPRSVVQPSANPDVLGQKQLECSDADVDQWHGKLLADERRMQWLIERRGLLVTTISDCKLGLDREGFYTIPARDRDGALVGVHRYKPAQFQSPEERARLAGDGGQAASMWLQVPGSTVTLWPLWRWPEDAETLVLCEGELDTLIARQHGFPAVTHTGGAATFKQEWAAQFKGYEVVIVYDTDGGGRVGSEKAAQILSAAGVSVRIAQLPADLGDGGDVTDFFLMGRPAADLAALLHDAELHAPAPAADERGPNGEQGQSCAAVDAIREAELKSYQRKRGIARYVRGDLLRRGRLCRDDQGRLYHFAAQHRRLRPIDSPEFLGMLENLYGLNPTEPEHKYTFEHLCSWAGEYGDLVSVRRLAHYDPTRQSLYVSRFDGGVCRLDGETVSVIDNGEDGHLFLDKSDWEPWGYVPAPPAIFWEAIPTQVNFTPGDGVILSTREQRSVFAAWLLSALFRDLLPTTRPILLLAGPKGSTKTSSSRLALKWLWGTRADVNTIDPEREDAFIAAVCNNPMVWFDNVDERVKWLPNRLAVTASGGRIVLRKLYTTNEEVTYHPDCLLALTARTPTFRREDVADRLIPLTTERVSEGNWVPDRDLLRNVLTKRNQIWGAALGVANEVVGRLKADGLPATANHRLADWASLAPVIGEALGVADEVRSALAKLSGAQSSFALADEPLYHALQAWLEDPSNRDRWLTTAELQDELGPIARAQHRGWPYANARALGQRLAHILDNLQELMGVERKSYGSTYQYAFRPKTK